MVKYEQLTVIPTADHPRCHPERSEGSGYRTQCHCERGIAERGNLN
ncbi:MAG: hypothetical protein ACYSUY_12510 [Planctomycetota bacterium]